METNTDSISRAVRSFGSEGIRIISLIVGFSMVHLVLMMAAFRSKRQNVNHLIAFILILVGSLGVLALGLAPVLNHMDRSQNRLLAIVGVVVALGALGAGLLFASGRIRVPVGHVMVHAPSEQHLSARSRGAVRRLREVADVRFDGRMPDRMDLAFASRCRFFVGFDTDEQFIGSLEFISQTTDAVFFALGSSRAGLLHPPNSFRVMASNDLQLQAARCHGGKRLRVVVIADTTNTEAALTDFAGGEVAALVDVSNAASVRAALTDAGVLAMVHVSPGQLAELAAAVDPADVAAYVRLTQSTAFDPPTDAVWAWMRAAGVSLAAVHSASLEPFSSTKDVVLQEALHIVRELVMGRLEDLRTQFEIQEFIRGAIPGMGFDTRHDRRVDTMALAVPHPAKNHWVAQPVAPPCKQ